MRSVEAGRVDEITEGGARDQSLTCEGVFSYILILNMWTEDIQLLL